MAKYIFDIECNGFLKELTVVWIIAVKDIETGVKKYWLPFKGQNGWKKVFREAELLVGHNITGYDLPAIEKVTGFKLPRSVRTRDTFIESLVIDYNRWPGGAHSLENWGIDLGIPKSEYTGGFDQYSEEMRDYCLQDLEVSEGIYKDLTPKIISLAKKNPNIKPYLRAEHFASEWSAKAEINGWPFDQEAALELFDTVDQELEAIREQIVPLLGYKTVAVDKKKGEVEVKTPKWTKKGLYDVHTARWFNIDPIEGLEDSPLVEGPYSRIEVKPLSIDSTDDVKIFLFRHNWKPTTWNYKKVPGEFKKQKTSPKITEDSLEHMGGNIALYAKYLSTRAKFSTLKTWIENVDENGRLHGECFVIGTPSMRTRHQIIVNVPSVATNPKWGKRMRSLFICKPGWKLIGCDSSGNQARGLAHYLNSQEYIDVLLNKDIHQYNADVLTQVLRSMGDNVTVVTRGMAKRILYAFLFGASGEKLWSYIFGILNKKKGDELKRGFTRAVPGFEALLKKLENIYGATKKLGNGYIPGIAGNRIYVDSFHKLLVYLLQACEKATCAAALMLTVQKLEEEEIPYEPCIFYHDEIDFMVPEEYAERACAIGANAFKEAPKLYGIQIMDGAGKIGHSWFDVH